MYPSLMGTFSCPAPVLMIGSSFGGASSSLKLVSMMRDTIKTPWSNICIHMTNCHYVSSHQNMSFESNISKNTKNLIIQKNLKKGLGFITYVTVCYS